LPRVAVLFLGNPEDTGKVNLAAFVEGMRAQGYVDGRNVVLDVNFARSQFDRLPEIIAGMLAAKPDVIVVPRSPAILAAKKATSTVPIVMAIAADPVEQGLVASLARPGGNVTGLASLTEVLAAKQLELLREVFPTASRFGYLMSPADTSAQMIWIKAEQAAKRLGVTLMRFEASRRDELDAVLASVAKQQPAALVIAQDALFNINRKMIVQSLARTRMPALHSYSEAAIDGGFLSYTAGSIAEFYRASARFVHRILKGAKPADLPVEQPVRFEVIVNLKTAKALGIVIPQSVLLRVDRAIE